MKGPLLWNVMYDGILRLNPLNTNSGVRQGCPLSKILIAIVLDDIISQLTWKKRAIIWSFTRHLEDLNIVEDKCLLAHKFSDMQAKA